MMTARLKTLAVKGTTEVSAVPSRTCKCLRAHRRLRQASTIHVWRPLRVRA